MNPEKFITLREVADTLGLPAFKLYRAVKRGDLPTYSIGNGRRLVRLSEVLAVVEASRAGGRP